MKRSKIIKASTPPKSRPVILSLAELRRRETALADFLKINGDTVRLLDETEGIFTTVDGVEDYLVTHDEFPAMQQLGEKYGYRVYQVDEWF